MCRGGTPVSYVPGYDYDFFVSYAGVDNDPVPSADCGWVTTLISILTSGSGLPGKLGRRETTQWMDDQNLRGNQEAEGTIAEQVKRSALFLAVLSPGYVASKFCQLELQTFLESAGISSERLFVVYRERLVESRHPMPEALRRPRKYKFWDLDKNNKPRPLGWPQPLSNNPDDRPYFQRVGDLCQEMADKLDEMRRKEQDRSGAPKPEGSQSLRVATNPRQTVLLAETTDDLFNKREEARRYLEQAGIAVLPAGRDYYGLSRPDYEKVVLSDLGNSAAFVQLLGPLLGRWTSDVPDGFGWLQYELAKREGRRTLQWRSPDLRDLSTVEDEKQRRLLETADAMPFEDFKQKIVRALRTEERKPSPRPSFIFINCDAVDIKRADDIGEHLGGTVDWWRPRYEDNPKAKKLQQEIESNLIDCDGLFIVFGLTRPGWVCDQIQLYRKLRPRRAKEPQWLAVVQAGPEPRELKGFGLAGLKFIGLSEIPEVIHPATAS
jgi:TIR domain-containing protein